MTATTPIASSSPELHRQALLDARRKANGGPPRNKDKMPQDGPASESVAGEEDPGAALDEPVAQAGTGPPVEKHEPAASKRA